MVARALRPKKGKRDGRQPNSRRADERKKGSHAFLGIEHLPSEELKDASMAAMNKEQGKREREKKDGKKRLK